MIILTRFRRQSLYCDNREFHAMISENLTRKAVYWFVKMGNVVGILTRLLTGRSGVRIPVRISDFSLLNNVLPGPEIHPVSYSMDAGFLSGG